MMKAGNYYVGDLCYVVNDDQWTRICDLTIVNDQVLSGEFSFDGIPFAMYNTTHGDGHYFDNKGKSYSVDSGSIGCIKVSDADPDKILDVLKYGLGSILVFQEEFVTAEKDGNIIFGDIVIDTDPDEEFDDEEFDRGF